MNGSIQEIILAHPFFDGLPVKHLCILTESAGKAAFAAGEYLFREAEPANRCYLIQKGRVALEARDPSGGSTLIQTLGSGDVLGWSWLFPPFAWHLSARAVDSVKAIVLDGGHLLAAANDDHDFGYELMKRVSRLVIERLQVTRNRFLAQQRDSKPVSGVAHANLGKN
jgi:CRP-like cAMP-binding protein